MPDFLTKCHFCGRYQPGIMYPLGRNARCRLCFEKLRVKGFRVPVFPKGEKAERQNPQRKLVFAMTPVKFKGTDGKFVGSR